MRGGSPGRTKLDYALDTAAGLARTALDAGDRVGLVAFDTRIYSELRPGTGHHHYLKLIDRLVEMHNVVDEDLTDLTNGELVATVARYLAHQEAVDVRLRRAPPLDSPAWERIHAGPTGELYDLGAMSTVVSTLLKSMGQAAAHKAMAPAWWWSRVHISGDSDPIMAKLRLFCRLRGIELPYRQEHEAGRRAAGMCAAINRVAAESRADVIVMISDLHGVLERPDLTVMGLDLNPVHAGPAHIVGGAYTTGGLTAEFKTAETAAGGHRSRYGAAGSTATGNSARWRVHLYNGQRADVYFRVNCQ